jgi:hypothetical protein
MLPEKGMTVMLRRIVIPLAVAWLASSAVCASEGCDAAFIQAFHECVRVVDSLRPDKSGQARVFAADGSEFTAGQAQWMQGQLRLIDRACARGDQTEATRLLSAVQDLLKSHERTS